MSTPGRGKGCIIAMYDSHAKTVMRNQCRNAIKSKRRRQKRETPGTESMQYLFEMQPHTDIYPSEHTSFGILIVQNVNQTESQKQIRGS